ncbi:MAG: hypothetical protein ACKO96_25445, partial [Flammeovirgaceae bacterium]
VWHRDDCDASAFRTTKEEGPKWDIVVRMVTTDLDTGKDFEYILIDKTKSLNYHGIIPYGPRKIMTAFYDKDDQSVSTDNDTEIRCCCENDSLLSRPLGHDII